MRNSRAPLWRRLGASLLVFWLLLSPTGLVGAAIQPSRAAGRHLRIESGGDTTVIASTLAYSEREIRQLLTTITIGAAQQIPLGDAGLDLQVGGNLQAEVGEKRTDGTLNADRMSVNGIVRGDSRQHVSVTRTGDGADANPATSQVRGNLKAQGIRNGSNESFAPTAANAPQSGQAAVSALLQSGLIQIRKQPAVQAALNAPTPNGAALTYKDDSGKVTLTLAGQAKVQAVYSQLQLTETFDVKHFADQGTAQLVTLVAAIALTVMTSGAGATLIGATAGTMSATVANAAFIAMASTMTGQLAGGASLGEAFEAGIKAGATSALTAGITYGMNDAMGMYAHDAQGNVVLESGAPKLSSSGVDYFKNTSALDKLGSSTFWTQTSISATVQGALSSAQGGSFTNGLTGSVAGSVGTTFNSAVGDWATQNGIASGDPAKVLLHATIGAAQASLTGQNALSGALGGASAEALAPVANQLDASTGNKLASELLTVGGALLANAALNPDAGAGGALTAANQALQTDRFNRQLHPKEIDLIKARAKDFAARMTKDGEPMTEAQAIKMLAENAADQVDNLDQRTPNGGSAYINAQAKQFLQQIGLDAGSFTDTRGLQIKYFTTETASGQQLKLDFSNTALYSEAYNSKSYQDFAYANLNRNLLGDKPTPEALRTYIDRETDQSKRAMAAAMLLAGAGGTALVVKLAPRLLIASKEFVQACVANPLVCMNQLGITAGEFAAGEALPTGLGVGTANILANKLFDKAKPWEIEQIGARLAKYTPDELLAINGVTQFKEGNRSSAEAVNALLELTNGVVAPYMPGTQVRDAVVGIGQKLYVVENASASGPGGWAATKVYTDLNEARREMALLPEWKNTFSQEGKINDLVIREYTVKQPLPTRQGVAGPQEEYFKNAAGQSVQTGQSYPGGGKQVELLIDTRSQVFDPKTSDALWKSYLNPTAQYRIGDRTVAPQSVVRSVP